MVQNTVGFIQIDKKCIEYNFLAKKNKAYIDYNICY